MYFDSAYRDVIRSINQRNLEPISVGLLYCHFRHDGISYENSTKEANVGKLKNKIRELGIYLRTFRHFGMNLLRKLKTYH